MSTYHNKDITSLRILLIEDNTDYAFSLIQGMSRYCLIDHASTEAEGLRMLYTESYDILLLDLTLDTGYMSGFRFLDYLARLERFNNLLVIGLSGMSLDDIYGDKSYGKLAAFLTKPVAAERLIQTIESCLLSRNETAHDETEAVVDPE